MAYSQRRPGAADHYDFQVLFSRSEDEGRTWSEPTLVNDHVSKIFMLQDVLLRTSSGRIILPVYLCFGQPGSPQPSNQEGAPNTGAYINGVFVSTNVHYYDPHFGASFVFLSDDDGRTWQRNRDGELFINLEPGGPMEPTFEPSVAEVAPGKLLMIMRTRLGRYYQARSYNNGETWTRPQPTQLAGTQSPAQVRTFKNGHLLCVFSQHNEEEVRKAFQETRLSSPISRIGGRLWEHFQNVESIHEETHVEPGPIRIVRAEAKYSLREGAAYENDTQYAAALPVGWGYWAYPSVLVLRDRVLISYSYSWYDENGVRRNPSGSKLKVLPIQWFYGGREPFENPILEKLKQP
jgi:hypothetical protein